MPWLQRTRKEQKNNDIYPPKRRLRKDTASWPPQISFTPCPDPSHAYLTSATSRNLFPATLPDKATSRASEDQGDKAGGRSRWCWSRRRSAGRAAAGCRGQRSRSDRLPEILGNKFYLAAAGKKRDPLRFVQVVAQGDLSLGNPIEAFSPISSSHH